MRRWLLLALFVPGCFADPGTSPAGGDSSGGSSSDSSAEGSSEASEGGSELPPTSTTEASTTRGSDTDVGGVCGDGNVDAGEECDSDDVPGGACTQDCTILCTEGARDCDRDVSNGCEATLDDDPANCGGCGNTCLSGVCIDGACGARAVDEGLVGVGATQIVRQGDVVFFDEGGIGSIRTWEIGSDTTTVAVTADQTSSFDGFVVAGDRLIWAERGKGAVLSAGLGKGVAETLFSLPAPGRIYRNPAHLFVPSATANDGRIARAPVAMPDAVETLVDALTLPVCRVVDNAEFVFFTQDDGSLNAFDKETEEVTLLSSAVLNPCARPLFAVGPALFFHGGTGASSTGLVRFVPNTNTATIVVEDSGGFISVGDYYVSGQGIVFSDQDEVFVSNLEGDDRVVVGASDQTIIGRYLDADIVMWAESGETGADGWTLWMRDRP